MGSFQKNVCLFKKNSIINLFSIDELYMIAMVFVKKYGN
jgi:hypothetical protein